MKEWTVTVGTHLILLGSKRASRLLISIHLACFSFLLDWENLDVHKERRQRKRKQAGKEERTEVVVPDVQPI